MRVLIAVALGSLLAAAPSVAQQAPDVDVLWVEDVTREVGRVITLRFPDQSTRTLALARRMQLPEIDGRAWRLEDLLVSLDVHLREPVATFVVAGPEFVVDQFERAWRDGELSPPIDPTVTVRELQVRCACR